MVKWGDASRDNTLANFPSVVFYDLTSEVISAILLWNLTDNIEVKEE
jgi:hypothetical protein